MEKMNIKDSKFLALDDELFSEYGKTFHKLIFGAMAMDLLMMQTVAVVHADKFGNTPINRTLCGPLLGGGAFTTD